MAIVIYTFDLAVQRPTRNGFIVTRLLHRHFSHLIHFFGNFSLQGYQTNRKSGRTTTKMQGEELDVYHKIPRTSSA